MTTLQYYKQNASKFKKWFPLLHELATPLDQKNCILPSTLDYLLPKIPNDCSFLDVGCGWGEFAKHLPESVSYKGIDNCQEIIAMAPQKQNVVFTLGDFHLLPYEDNSFDIILANDSLHFGNINNALNEIRRVLKPDGIFYSKLWLFRDDMSDELTALTQSNGFKYFSQCFGIDPDPNVFGFRKEKDYKQELDSRFNWALEAPTETNSLGLKGIVNPVFGMDKSEDDLVFIEELGMNQEEKKELKRMFFRFFAYMTCSWSGFNFFSARKK